MCITWLKSTFEAERGRIARFEKDRIDANAGGLDVFAEQQKAHHVPKCQLRKMKEATSQLRVELSATKSKLEESCLRAKIIKGS